MMFSIAKIDLLFFKILGTRRSSQDINFQLRDTVAVRFTSKVVSKEEQKEIFPSTIPIGIYPGEDGNDRDFRILKTLACGVSVLNHPLQTVHTKKY